MWGVYASDLLVLRRGINFISRTETLRDDGGVGTCGMTMGLAANNGGAETCEITGTLN